MPQKVLAHVPKSCGTFHESIGHPCHATKIVVAHAPFFVACDMCHNFSGACATTFQLVQVTPFCGTCPMICGICPTFSGILVTTPPLVFRPSATVQAIFVKFGKSSELQIKSSLYLLYYTEACNELRGPSPRLSAWATQLRRIVAMVASCW